MMKYIKKAKVIILALLAAMGGGCEENFEAINENPNGIVPTNATPSGVMATIQIYAFGEPRFVTWRGNIIYGSRFAHHYIYNFGDMAWFPGAAYVNNQGWTDAVWESSNIKVAGHINALRSIINTEQQPGEAAVLEVIAAWFYQKMTDIYGDIPYSEVARPQSEVVLKPQYDPQVEIYQNIITSLGQQIAILEATEKLVFAGGDFLYGNDPLKWAAFANTLRLRMALRAREAFINSGLETFVAQAIEASLSKPLIEATNQAVFNRASEGLFLSDPNELMGGQEDIWHSFAYNQAQWVYNERVINLLQDHNDPRLPILATETDSLPGIYAGTEPNLKGPPKWGFLSKPTGVLRGNQKNDPVPAHIIMAAESHFLQAEAALLGYSTGNSAEGHYQSGIRAHMETYQVPEADIVQFLNTSSIAQLSGSEQENLLKVWQQRWLAYLNNGYEAWALVRRTDMIPEQTGTQYLPNDTNGEVPSRLVYPVSEGALNAKNRNKANGGKPDLMTTKVWWDLK